MSTKNLFASIFSLLMISSSLTNAQYALVNPEEVKNILNQNANCDGLDFSHIKIAVIDEGFPGFTRFKKVLGPRVQIVNLLPQQKPQEPVIDKGAENSNDEESSVEVVDDSSNYEINGHGFAMAQVMMASSCAWFVPNNKKPYIYLLPVRSYSTYDKAKDFILKNNIDIVLHSLNLDWSSNFNGDGFLNKIVSEATSKGAIWVNSAGNNGKLTYHSKTFQVMGSLQKGEVHLPHEGETLMFENYNDDNQLKVTLSWNDFRDNIIYGTKKDLDIKLFEVMPNGKLRQVEESKSQGQKRQIGRQAETQEEALTSTGNAFEQIQGVTLKKGIYALKVYLRSNLDDWNIDDEFRIILTSQQPESLKMFGSIHRLRSEITPPADNVDVITVGVLGAPFSAQGYTRNNMRKPDVMIATNPESQGSKYSNASKQLKPVDTSDAAALVAGSILLMKAENSSLSKDSIFDYIEDLRRQQGGSRDVIWMSPYGSYVSMNSQRGQMSQPSEDMRNYPQMGQNYPNQSQYPQMQQPQMMPPPQSRYPQGRGMMPPRSMQPGMPYPRSMNPGMGMGPQGTVMGPNGVPVPLNLLAPGMQIPPPGYYRNY